MIDPSDEFLHVLQRNAVDALAALELGSHHLEIQTDVRKIYREATLFRRIVESARGIAGLPTCRTTTLEDVFRVTVTASIALDLLIRECCDRILGERVPR